MRGQTFVRQLRLLQLLETRKQGVELDEAADELGAHRRTVYRDFQVLEEAGIPLQAEQEGRHARWKVMDGYRHRLQLSLSWSEMLALSVGSKLLEGLAGTLFHTSAVSALEKLRASFPKVLSERIRAHDVLVSAQQGGRDYQARDEVVRVLVEAIDRRLSVHARYRSRMGAERRGAFDERRLDPYHLRVSNQGLYVLAWCHRASRVKTFLVDRFQEARLTEESFTPAPDFDPAEALASAFDMWEGPARRVQLRIGPPVADLVMERKVHPSQLAQRNADCTVDVRLFVPVYPPLIAWLMSLGPALLHVEPAGLRRKVTGEHARAVRGLGSQRSAASRRPRPAPSRRQPVTSPVIRGR